MTVHPVPTVNRQQQRSDLSTRRLLDATAALIAERGLERTTLADIGERAGYSQGLVTRRFGSKSKLLVALVDRLTARFGPERLGDTVGERTGVAAVRHIFEEIREDALRAPSDVRGFYGLMFEGVKPVPELRDRLRDLNRAFRHMLADLIAAGVRDGTVASVDPVAAANLITATLRGVAFLWMLDPEDVDFAAELDSAAVHLTRLLAPQPTLDAGPEGTR
ncbi:MAG TPA: TetR/AcrR family transcriptional regulator [Amycolatopsis sp.]|nr:TetR/AcrR family transcriptional regulator [Amycolatopsis sp.]